MTPGPLDALLGVQDLDTQIAQLEHRRASLPEAKELAEVERALGEVERRVTHSESERAELARHQGDLEAQISAAASRQGAIEARLYSTRGGAARDLQAMDEEIAHLRQRKNQLEEDELEVMVALEPVDVVLAELSASRRELTARADALRAALARAKGAIDAERSERERLRQDAARGIPQDLLERYEVLRSRLGGTGAARLVGNRCSGCHLELPSMEVDRIRRLPLDAVVTCEQCGRILVHESG